jgi:hypothetical protein
MYNYLCYYGIFALSVGITSYFSVYRPILLTLQKEDIPIINHPIISTIMLMLLGTLCAPFIFITTITGASDDLKEIIVTIILKDKD